MAKNNEPRPVLQTLSDDANPYGMARPASGHTRIIRSVLSKQTPSAPRERLPIITQTDDSDPTPIAVRRPKNQ